MTDLDLENRTIDKLEMHRRQMRYEIKHAIPDEHLVRDLLDKTDRHDRLLSSLRRGAEHVRQADNGNVVIDDGDNLVVLRPDDAAALASALNMAAHGEDLDE